MLAETMTSAITISRTSMRRITAGSVLPGTESTVPAPAVHA